MQPRVPGRGTWGPARRARCRAPGTNAPHAGARRARGRMVRRVRREESRSGRRSREPVARRAACARARRPSTCTRARRWSRASHSKRRDVAGRQRGSCNPSRDIRPASATDQNRLRLVTKVDQSSQCASGPIFRLTAPRGNHDPRRFPTRTAIRHARMPQAGRFLARLSLRIYWENDGGSLYGIQEVDGSIPFSSTTLQFSRLSRAHQTAISKRLKHFRRQSCSSTPSFSGVCATRGASGRLR